MKLPNFIGKHHNPISPVHCKHLDGCCNGLVNGHLALVKSFRPRFLRACDPDMEQFTRLRDVGVSNAYVQTAQQRVIEICNI